jgi:hypothetical protein
VTTTLAIPDHRKMPPTKVVLHYFSFKPRRRQLWVGLNLVLMFVVIWQAIDYGLIVRRKAWEDAYLVHFRISLNNAIKWGHFTNEVGILNVYQKIIDDYGDDLQQEPGDGRLALDYPPLRLLIMSTWEAWTERQQTEREVKRIEKIRPVTNADLARIDRQFQGRYLHWQDGYEFNWPVLAVNTGCELAGAVAMFLLVHYWLRICSGAPPRQWIDPLRCAWPALFSALLLWFSPALIYNAHSYPQWDCWIVAPFLFAMYFGMLDLWLISGLFIGTVSMAKGQILLVTPVLVMWQLMMMPAGEIWHRSVAAFHAYPRRDLFIPHLLEILKLVLRPFGVILRLGVGIILAIGLVASPWLTGAPIAETWIIWLIAALGVLSVLFFLRKRSPVELCIQAGVLLVAFFMVIWPWIRKPRPDFSGYTFLAFVGFAIAARFIPRRWAFTWAATAIALALYACVPLFNTSMAWYTIGIKFPTEHWQLMYWCHAMNLGAILNEKYHWEFTDTVNLLDYVPFLQTSFYHSVNHFLAAFGVDWALPLIPMRFLMIGLYFVCIFLCAIGMAIHTRRKDRMFFFAMVAPWVLMYALLPQMQNRYSVWAAAFAAATASFSLDGFMLFLLLNALNVVDTAWDMMYRAMGTQTQNKWMPYIGRDDYGRPQFGGIGPLFPDLGWAALLIAAIYLYLALRRDRRHRSLILPTLPVAIPSYASPAGGFEVVDPQVRDGVV